MSTIFFSPILENTTPQVLNKVQNRVQEFLGPSLAPSVYLFRIANKPLLARIRAAVEFLSNDFPAAISLANELSTVSNKTITPIQVNNLKKKIKALVWSLASRYPNIHQNPAINELLKMMPLSNIVQLGRELSALGKAAETPTPEVEGIITKAVDLREYVTAGKIAVMYPKQELTYVRYIAFNALFQTENMATFACLRQMLAHPGFIAEDVVRNLIVAGKVQLSVRLILGYPSDFDILGLPIELLFEQQEFLAIRTIYEASNEKVQTNITHSICESLWKKGDFENARATALQFKDEVNRSRASYFLYSGMVDYASEHEIDEHFKTTLDQVFKDITIKGYQDEASSRLRGFLRISSRRKKLESRVDKKEES